VVSNFIVQALKNEPITLYGDGFGWQAATPLAEGLRHTIAYFDDLLRAG
jgi:hypothetical protein